MSKWCNRPEEIYLNFRKGINKMKKRVASIALAGVLALSSLSSFAGATSTLSFKENTAKFDLSVSRSIWNQGNASEGHRLEINILNRDLSNLNNWVLEFDYDGVITGYDKGNVSLAQTTPNHYVVKPLKWANSLGKNAFAFGISGTKTNGDIDFNNVLLSSNERPLKITEINQWALNGTYKTGDIVSHKGKFYAAIQGHTAYAANWEPSVYTKALWRATTLKVGETKAVMIVKK
jgi:hypothetical protein